MHPSPKVAFITGLNGQDGSYLAELLLEKGYYVYGILRRMSNMNIERIEAIVQSNSPYFSYNYGDITDAGGLFTVMHRIFERHRGDRNGNGDDVVFEIYHLAAQSDVRISFDMPEYTTEVAAMGTLRLLEICRHFKQLYQLRKEQLKIYNACTSEMYGKALQIPQNEQTPFNPRSPYAIAKQFAYYTAKNYREAYDMFISNGILFNHESPRRGFNFATRKITLGLSKILKGEMEVLEMGNLDAVRDWGHAKDYVAAMHQILQHTVPEDFVIATNETHTVREFIEESFGLRGLMITWVGEKGSLDEVGIDQYKTVRIRIHPDYFRPTEVDYLQGDATKAYQLLGWRPSIDFKALVEDMVNADCT